MPMPPNTSDAASTSSWRPFRLERALHLAQPRITLHNACVEYPDVTNPVGKGVRATFVSRNGTMAMIHGFNEFTFSFRSVASVRHANSDDRARIAAAKHYSLGIALQFASLNLGHQIHHTVAAWDALHQHAPSASDQHQAAFIPVPSALVGKSLIQSPRHRANGLMRIFGNAAWELALRGFTSEPPETLANRSATMVMDGLTCFDRIEGGFGGISVYSMDESAVQAGIAWRRAVLRFVGRMRPPAPGPEMAITTTTGRSPRGRASARGAAAVSLLYVVRGGRTRQIRNDRALMKALSRLPGLKITRARMELLSLSQQLQLVASSSAMMGVHGMGLVHSPFLPSESQRTALVEIQPPRALPQWKHIFSHMVQPCNIRYVKHPALLAPQSPNCTKCRCSPGSPLDCNVTVDVVTLTKAIKEVVAWVGGKNATLPAAA